MSNWMNVLGSLAALAQQSQQASSGKTVPAEEPESRRQPPAGRLTGELGQSELGAEMQRELAEAEAETRRMWEEAARETARETATRATQETFRSELKPWEQRLSQTEAKVIDTDAAVVKRLSRMEEALEAIDMKALEAERFERKLNLLMALVVIGFGTVLFLALR